MGNSGDADFATFTSYNVFIGTSTAYCWQVQFLLIVIKWRFILTLL